MSKKPGKSQPLPTVVIGPCKATDGADVAEVINEIRDRERDALVKHMVDRFLGWRLPEHFRPDAGISFNPEYNVEYSAARGLTPPRHQPIGTNLFDREQAEVMVRYMVEGMPSECVYCERGERCVMHGKSGFLAGRLGHTAWCSHMVDDKTCNCGASFPTSGRTEHG